MRILIDTTQIPLRRTGVGLYAEHLIQKLIPILQLQDRLFVLVQDDDVYIRQLVAAHANLSPIPISSRLFRNKLALTIYEQCVLPWIVLDRRIDLVHSLHYTFPLLCHCSRVVTIHDMTHSLWPEMHTFGRRVAMSFFSKMALRHAEGVLFVSASTQRDAERLFGSGRNLRNVTPLAVDHAMFEDIQPETIAETLSRIGIERPYILFLGTLEPRKNVVRLIEAFELVGQKHSQHKLVIAGKLGWHYAAVLEAIERSPLRKRIHRLGYVATEDKAPLIAGCDLLVYPSLYEGFGLPVLEGMAAGVPVITGNVSSIPEVTGDAAVLIDPSSVEQLSIAMDSVLSDHNYSDWLRRAGKEQAHRFSWERTARLTYAAYVRLTDGLRN